MIEAVLNRSLSDGPLFAIVAVVVMLEIALAILLWTNHWPLVTSAALVAMMFGFTGITAVLAVDPTAPPCGCAGGPKTLGDDVQAANQLALGRNVFLLAGALWIWSIALASRRGARERP